MGDILCLEDVPFQCQQCKSHFPSENSLKLHCFMEEHKMVSDQHANRNCNCGTNKKEPHQCATCKLIGVSLEDRRAVRSAADQVYAQSQLWKCSGCGMLWKCIDCGVLFKGSNMFRQHMPHCQNVQETLKRMKSEKDCDEEASDMKGKLPVKVEKLDVKHKIKPEPIDRQVECNTDSKIKQEAADSDIKYQVKKEINGKVKEECDVNVRCSVKQEPKGNTENECKLNGKSPLKQEVDENSEGNRRSSRISYKRTNDGNHNLRERKK